MNRSLYFAPFPRYTGRGQHSGEYLLMLIFAIGIGTGILWGIRSGGSERFTSPEEYLMYSSGSAAECLWKSLTYFLLSMICATSYLGVAAIPALMFARGWGFALSCTTLCMTRGASAAAAIMGIPALVSIPAFILCSQECFDSSLELLSMRFKPAYRNPVRPFRPGCWVFIIFSLILTFIYNFSFLPILISKM